MAPRVAEKQRPTEPPPFKRVLVAGQEYTTLERYCNGKQPGPRARAKVQNTCGCNALVLEGGDHKTLEAGGFVSQAGKELLPCGSDGCPPKYLPSTSRKTACLIVATGEPVTIQRLTRATVKVTGRRLVPLWRVADLHQYVSFLNGRH